MFIGACREDFEKNLQWNVRSLYNLPPLHLRSVRGDDIRCRVAGPRGLLPHQDTRPLRRRGRETVRYDITSSIAPKNMRLD
ncbi:hypothetical protein TNCV_5141981 [Trichonephila clavipes]|nr:hypothetical protein TNCV_5141981 [Trichonephila clavipes]